MKSISKSLKYQGTPCPQLRRNLSGISTIDLQKFLKRSNYCRTELFKIYSLTVSQFDYCNVPPGSGKPRRYDPNKHRRRRHRLTRSQGAQSIMITHEDCKHKTGLPLRVYRSPKHFEICRGMVLISSNAIAEPKLYCYVGRYKPGRVSIRGIH